MFLFSQPSPPLDFDWQPPAEADLRACPRGGERKRWRRSWRISRWLHVCVAAGAVTQWLLAMSFAVPAPSGVRQIEITGVLQRDSAARAEALASLPIQI